MACRTDQGNARPGARGRAQALNRHTSALVFQLCEDQVFEATSTNNDGDWDDYVITGAEFAQLGPALQDLVMHSEGSNFSADFQYRVILQYKYKNGPWLDATPIVVQAIQSTDAYKVSASFSDRTKFGMTIRLVLQTQVGGAATKTQKGNLTIGVAVRLLN